MPASRPHRTGSADGVPRLVPHGRLFVPGFVVEVLVLVGGLIAIQPVDGHAFVVGGVGGAGIVPGVHRRRAAHGPEGFSVVLDVRVAGVKPGPESRCCRRRCPWARRWGGGSADCPGLPLSTWKSGPAALGLGPAGSAPGGRRTLRSAQRTRGLAYCALRGEYTKENQSPKNGIQTQFRSSQYPSFHPTF